MCSTFFLRAETKAIVQYFPYEYVHVVQPVAAVGHGTVMLLLTLKPKQSHFGKFASPTCFQR